MRGENDEVGTRGGWSIRERWTSCDPGRVRQHTTLLGWPKQITTRYYTTVVRLMKLDDSEIAGVTSTLCDEVPR